MRVHQCPTCGYLHRGEIDFHFCPVCSSPAEIFVEDTTVEHFANWNTKSRMMINSMAETWVGDSSRMSGGGVPPSWASSAPRVRRLMRAG